MQKVVKRNTFWSERESNTDSEKRRKVMWLKNGTLGKSYHRWIIIIIPFLKIFWERAGPLLSACYFQCMWSVWCLCFFPIVCLLAVYGMRWLWFLIIATTVNFPKFLDTWKASCNCPKFETNTSKSQKMYSDKPDNKYLMMIILDNFLYFSTKIYVVGTH